ncbi:MAG: hypothetical protein IJQ98_03100 [Oscillospiraceae bacterium]|nr:hypothetical protein [Oscillospiraceae bacterium]
MKGSNVEKTSSPVWENITGNKPLLVVLGALALIIILTVAVTLTLRGLGGTGYSVDDEKYPYTWAEKNDGTVAITLKTGDAAKGVWSLGSTQGDVLTVNVGNTSGGKTGVTLIPNSIGREIMTFDLMSGEEHLAEVTFTVDVAGESDALAATVTSQSERAFQNTLRGGEETGFPFTVRATENGLSIFVEDPGLYSDEGTEWLSDSSDSMVASVYGVDASEEGVNVLLQTRSNGTSEVRVYNVEKNLSFVFDVQVTKGEMLIAGSRSEPYQTAQEPEDTEQAQARLQPSAA